MNSNNDILAQGTAMVSRVLPVKKPDLTPLDFPQDESNTTTVVPDSERSFNSNQRMARVQGLDPLAIKKAGKSFSNII